MLLMINPISNEYGVGLALLGLETFDLMVASSKIPILIIYKGSIDKFVVAMENHGSTRPLQCQTWEH